MGFFIRKVMIFLIPVLVLSPILDYFISSGLNRSNNFARGESLIWKEIFEGNIISDLYIYGSSRAWVHFDPQLIEDSLGITSYNFGIDGHSFWLQHLRHKVLMKNNQRPKIIILSLDMFSLKKSKDLYNSNQFLTIIFDKDVFEYTSSYNGFSLLDYYIPLIRYYGKIKVIKESLKNWPYATNEELYRHKGFKGMNRKWNDDLIQAKSKMNSFEVKNDKNHKNLMNDFLLECKTLGIAVVLVYSPEYIEGQQFVKNRQEIIDTYEDLAIKHKFPFIDYSSDELCRNKEMFYNSMHLNAVGAKIFTNKLISDLRKLSLIEENSF